MMSVKKSDVFGSDFNQVTIISKSKSIKLPRLSKLETADKILDEIINLIP